MSQMDTAQAIELYRKLAREFGKQGGRPRTIEHTEEPGCRCADCREAKARVAKKRIKKK